MKKLKLLLSAFLTVAIVFSLSIEAFALDYVQFAQDPPPTVVVNQPFTVYPRAQQASIAQEGHSVTVTCENTNMVLSGTVTSVSGSSDLGTATGPMWFNTAGTTRLYASSGMYGSYSSGITVTAYGAPYSITSLTLLTTLTLGGSGSFVVTLKDEWGNTIPNTAISAVIVPSGSVTVDASQTTDASGNATFNITAGSIGGQFTVTLTAGTIQQQFTFDVSMEPTPNAAIDYVNETLTGLTAGDDYTVDGGNVITANGGGEIAIDESWMNGAAHAIVKKGDGTSTSDSDAQNLTIPARPAAPGSLIAIHPSSAGGTGDISGTTTAMEYSIDQTNWTNCAANSTTGLAPDTYYVRAKAVAGVSFAGTAAQIAISALTSPALTLSASPPSSLTLPGSVTLTAALTGAAPDNSGKTITFTMNGTNVGTATTNSSGIATYTLTNPTVGTYTFDASFAGNAQNYAATAVQITGYTVSRGAQTALSIIGLGNSYTYGDNPLTLSTSGGSGGGAVSYTSSDPLVASVQNGVPMSNQATVTILKAGTFTITATKAADANYAESQDTSAEVTVSQADPTVTLTGANVAFGENVTLNVTVSGAGATPDGTVTFKENGVDISGAVNLSGGSASFTTTNPPSGGDNIYSAEYSGQTDYYNSGSDSINVDVDKIDQTGFAITVPGAITYGDSGVSLTAAGGQSTGGVAFSVQPNNVARITSGGALTINNAGTVTVTATKAGDTDYNAATAELDITINPRGISNVSVTVIGPNVYTGSQLQPAFSVSDGVLAIDTGDYYNEYGANINAGIDGGSITLTGQRNYTGTKTVSFDIEQRPLTGAAITLAAGPYIYTGAAVEPAVTGIVAGGITVPASEYDVSYSNNIGTGTATVTVTVTAKANGNFSGSVSADFTIEVNLMSLDAKITEAKAIQRGSYTTATWDALQAAITNAETVRQAPGVTQSLADAEVNALTAAMAGLRTSGGGSGGGRGSSTYNYTLYAGRGDLEIDDNEPPLSVEPIHTAYISGYPNGTFRPDSSMTRAEAAALFYNLLDDTDVSGGSFMDVFSVAWYYDAVTALSGAGIISGYSDGSFGPDNTITRAEFVTMAMRFAGVSSTAGKAGFPDVDSAHWAAGYIAAATDGGYISGYPDGSFGPNNQITRAEAVTILNKIRGCAGLDQGKSFTDVPVSHWAYEAITAAATDHTHE